LPRILGLTVSEFAEQYPHDKFGVVTFLEVLGHQTAPAEFVEQVKSCLRPRGYMALSVRDVMQMAPYNFSGA
jgi:2-polyprenyl-3-methyl-5-hydroxy-6-metoxy-1,4-benzoquinol methylase